MNQYLERNNQLWVVILCLTTFIAVYFSPVDYGNSDPRGTLMTSQAMLQLHTLALDAYGDNAKGYQYGQYGGHIYYGYPLGAPIFSLPVVWLANLRGMDMQNLNDDRSVQKTIAAIIVALASLLIYGLCRCFVDYTHSFLLSIAFALGSSIASSLGTALWSVDFETLVILLCLLLLVYDEQKKIRQLNPFLIGFLLFASYLCRPTSVVFILLVLGYLFLKKRDNFIPALITLLVLVAGLMLIWYSMYHQLLSPYYQGVTFFKPPPTFFLAVYAELLSPSRGVLVFSPYLFITLAGTVIYFQQLRHSALFWLVIVWSGLHLILISLNPLFWGGSSYGNRLFADAIPGLLVWSLLVWQHILTKTAIKWREAATSLLGVLTVFSVFVHSVQGLYNPYTAVWNDSLDVGENWRTVLDWRYPQFLSSPGLLASRDQDRVESINKRIQEIAPTQTAQATLDQYMTSTAVVQQTQRAPFPTPTPTSAPFTPEPISVNNLNRLTQLMMLGRGTVDNLAWSTDGKTIGVAGKLGVWIYSSENLLATPRLFEGQSHIDSVAFSSDGKYLASASADKTIRVWDVQTERNLFGLFGHTEAVTSVAFSPDGSRLASASADKTIRLWDIQTGQSLLTLQGHTNRVTSVAFSPDGKRLASASADKTIRLWDAQGGQSLATLQGHTDSVTSVAFSPDGKRLASASADKTIRLWDAQSGRSLATLQGHTDSVTSVVFSPDGKRLASASADKTIHVWDAQSGQSLATLQGHTDSVSSVAFSPDGKRLASVSADNTIRLWDAQSGQMITASQGHTDIVYALAYSADGTRLASASYDKNVYLWDTQTGQMIATLRGHTNSVTSVAFSPDGTRLASSSADKTIRLWNVQSGQTLITLQGHTDVVTSVAFSPDGTRLASSSADKTIQLWDAQTGQSLTTLREHTDIVNSIVFSPDGTRLASASADKTVRLWNAQVGQIIATLPGHTNFVNSVAFSPDGNYLVSGGEDKTIRLWDVQTAQLLMTLRGLTDPVFSVVFNPKKHTFGSAGYDGIIRLWGINTIEF